MPLSKLDFEQVIQSSFDETNEALKVNVVATAPGNNTTAINDGTNPLQKATVNASGELLVSVATLADPATETTLAAFSAKSASAFVSTPYDYLEQSYIPSGDGAGQAGTVTFKSGGAAGTIVALLTLVYDSSGRLISVTKT